MTKLYKREYFFIKGNTTKLILRVFNSTYSDYSDINFPCIFETFEEAKKVLKQVESGIWQESGKWHIEKGNVSVTNSKPV